MVKKSLCLLLCAAMLILCGCTDSNKGSTSSALSDYPVTSFDITVKKCPQRVISLSPVVTDIIIALGSDAQLTGISDNCVEHRDLPRFGSSTRPDIAAVKKEKPDLVFVSGSAHDNDISLLMDAGIKVARVALPESYVKLADLYTDVAMLMSGNITGVRNASNTFTEIDSSIKKAANTSSTKLKAAVFVSDTVTLPDGCVAAELATFAGISELIGGTDKKIIEASPELIICPKGAAAQFTARFEGVRVAEFDIGLFDRRGEQMTKAVTDLIALIEQ